MREHEPKATGDNEPTSASILYDSVQRFVAEWGAVARDRHITDYQASTEEVDDSFVGFVEGERAFSFRFHVDDIDTATLEGIVASPGYSEISLALWRGNEPAELGTTENSGIDNNYSVVLLEGKTPFLAKSEDIDGFMSPEDLQTHHHETKIAGAEHFLEMATQGRATMHLLDDGTCAELLGTLTSPKLPEYITSD